MSYRLIAGLSLCLALSGCNRAPPVPPAAASAPAPALAGKPAADPGEGPRLVLSPDGVHIEYRVFGHGEPAVILVHG